MKTTYPYSKDLKKPVTFNNIDFEKIILDGKMKSTADFLQKQIQRFKPKGSQVQRMHYTSFDGAQIPYYIFSPRDTSLTNSPLPAIIYYHGGGFMFPIQKSMMNNSDLFVTNLGVRVFIPDYRTSLTECCDTIVEDCYEMLHYVFKNAIDLGVDPDRVVLYGDSAGGSLTESVAILNRDRETYPICGQLLAYPVCDNESWKYMSVEKYQYAPWSKTANEQMWRIFLMRGCRDLKKVIPMKNDLHGLPPTYMEPLEIDILRDEALAYSEKLRKANVAVTCNLVKGAYHGYDADLKSPLVKKIFARRYEMIRSFIE